MTTEPTRVCAPGRIARVVLEQGEGGLSLVVTMRPLDGLRSIVVRFHDVRDLRFRGESVELISRVVLLLARDMTADGWDGVRYRVSDAEEEFAAFYCAAFDVRDD